MPDQPVVGILQELPGHQFQQALFDLERGLALGDAGAVGDPEDVGVDGHGGLAERGIEDDVGGLASDTRQGLEVAAAHQEVVAQAEHDADVGLEHQAAEQVRGLSVGDVSGADF